MVMTDRMEGGWRRLILAAVVLAVVVTPGHCLGAMCTACNVKDSDRVCQNGEPYTPVLAVTDTFCSDLRNNALLVKELCDRFPNGYKVMCERPIEPKFLTCKKQVCPTEPAPQTAEDNGAFSQTHHAPGFLFIAVVALLAWRMRSC